MICHDCNKEISKSDNGGTGYGTVLATGEKVCYACCALRDIESMKTDNHATLYLSKSDGKWQVTNWPGTLKFNVSVRIHPNGHNWGLERRDCWFVDASGNHWHGVSYDGWTELVHCKKLKHKIDGLQETLQYGSQSHVAKPRYSYRLVC